MFLVCLVILQNRVTKGSCDLGKSPFCQLGGHKHCGSRDIIVSVCHIISEDHVVKGSCDFIGRSVL